MSVEVKQSFVLADLTVSFTFSGHSDRGSVRRLNEDSFLVSAPVFVVADGMGGHAFGDRASQAAIAAFTDAFADDSPARSRDVLDAISAANDAVRAISSDDAVPGGISGTTLTGVAFVDIDASSNYHWMAFNVGDSRTYSWDGRTLAQLSVDHSAVQELVEAGEITPAQAATHPHRNVVTRALGAEDDVDPDIWILPARARQTFLLCSDGLTKELSDDEIARIIVFHDTVQQSPGDGLPLTLAERLVRAAVAAGGSDNVTVVVVEAELVGSTGAASGDDTVDRDALSGVLEDTRPRG